MRKTLYWLMQATQAWNLHLHRTMLDIGYVHVAPDHCIYMCKTVEGSLIIAIHVDDMCPAASNMSEMAKLKMQLGKSSAWSTLVSSSGF